MAIRSSTEPRLSVILPAKSGATIATTLEHLRAQTIAGELEVVLVTESVARLDNRPGVLDSFMSDQIVEVGPFERLSQAACAGIRAAAAPVVVIAEDHSHPEPDWAEALVRRHQEPWAAVGPAVVNANPDSLLGWADFILAFAPFIERDEAMEMELLPGHNCSYKRDVLLEYGTALEDLIENEYLLQSDLRARGYRLFFDPAARTRHTNITRLTSWIANRFWSSWAFATLRARGWHWSRRLLYLACGPLLPAVRLWRLGPDVRRIGRRHRVVSRALPALVLEVFIGTIGEMLGYAVRDRVRALTPLDVEIDRLRHVTRRPTAAGS